MGPRAGIVAALALTACAPPAPARGPAGDPPCALDHVWDPLARACRLFPGGGYGWAGCSMSTATEPPNGERCLTGTHWDKCDCVCDPPATAYDRAAHLCR